MAYDPNNIFAKIIRGEMPCHKLAETDDSLAFLDVFPQSRGHSLVIPKRAGEMLFDTDPEELAKTMGTLHQVASALRTVLKPDGLVLTQFSGAPAGQTVFHLHFHLIPRYADEAIAGHGRAGKADDDELAALAQEIRAALSS